MADNFCQDCPDVEACGQGLPCDVVQDAAAAEAEAQYAQIAAQILTEQLPSDPVNHPAHYNQYPVEVIEITEHLNFCLGNAVKYILRADFKGEPIQDLEKAVWYLQREIDRREREQ